MSSLPENFLRQELPTSRPFSTLDLWTFDPNGLQDLVLKRVQELCRVTQNVVSVCGKDIEEYDIQCLESATKFLLNHDDHFTIAAFMNCLDIKSSSYDQLSKAIFGNTANTSSTKSNFVSDNDEVTKLRLELAEMKQLFKVQASKLQEQAAETQTVKNGVIETHNLAQQTADVISGAASNAAQNQINGGFKFSNPTRHNSNFSNFNSGTSSNNNPNGGGNNNPNNPNPNGFSNDQFQQILAILNVKNNQPKRISIDINPDIFVRKTHKSLRCYARKNFSIWARTQGLVGNEMIPFFCLAFSNEIERTHVDKLSVNPDGTPKFDSVLKLVDQIVKELHFDEETAEDLQDNFKAFRARPKIRLDTEFLRCCELREIGWPEELENDKLVSVKYHFSRRLAMDDKLHSYVFAHCKLAEWKSASSYYEISIQLRELQNLYGNSTKALSGINSNTKPTNTDLMDTTNAIQDIESQNTPEVPAQMNNISKSCKNSECNKSFTPTNPKYFCCSPECVTTFKKLKFAAIKSRSRVKKSKPTADAMNNLATQVMNMNKNSEVSIGDFFITPTHFNLGGGRAPVVISNSLFDTGASVTIMTLDMLKRMNLEHALVRDNSPVLAGDKTVMKGRIGYITVDFAMEDSMKYKTDDFTLKVLIYVGLNNDFVIGRDAMKIGVRSFFCIPDQDMLVFNPTIKIIRALQERRRDITRTSQVPRLMPKIVESSESVDNIVPVSVNKSTYQPPKFDDTESFMLNVPLAKTNETNAIMFAEKLNEITTEFMNNVEQFGETSLSDVLTTGGLDGTLDTEKVKISDTKLIQSNKGPVKVGAQLSEGMCKRFNKFVDNYKGKVFDHTTLGATAQVCHPEIKEGHKTTCTTPKYMPLNPFMREEAGSLVQKMVDLGVITETTQPANSSIFIVQKSSGKWRLICDLRSYNDKIQDYIVHLPSPYELINKICQFEMFSYMDFPDAYFQVPLSKESIKNNPIVASVSGLPYNFLFLKMAQGLKIATAWFIGILNRVYAKIADWLVNYLDDSVLGSPNDEEVHFKRIVEFVDITSNAGLRLSLPKSVFFATNLCFLNYSLTKGAWSLSDSQRATINALNVDKLTKAKRESLAAFINHFNRFHTGVSYAARRIRDVETSVETVKSILDNIKKKLIESPALKSVNFTDPLLIYTDASKFDCSGVILQKSKDGTKLVTCFSKKFPQSVVVKPVHERELYSLQQISLTYRYLLIGRHRKTFFNDSRIILASEKSKAPSLRCLFDTIKSSFSNVEFKFTPTNQNSSDIFTRVNNITEIMNNFEAIKEVPNNFTTEDIDQFNALGFDGSSIESSAESDSVADQSSMDSVISESNTSVATSRPIRGCADNKMPENLKNKILKIHVNSGCQSAQKICMTFQQLGHSLSVKDVVDVLAGCDRCSDIRNHQRPRKSAPGITLSKEVTTQCALFIDFKQILGKDRIAEIRENSSDQEFNPESENKSCLTIFEPVSSLVQFVPVSDYTSETVKAGLRQYFQTNGPSKAVICDNALSFTSLKSWLMDEYHCELFHTSVYHPASNLSERAHREFECVLKTFDTSKKQFNFANWEDNLAKAVIATNSLKHSVHKVSPYEVSKNRHQTDIEPVSFYPVGVERKLVDDKFCEKVDKIIKSKLKVVLPIFKKGDEIKCAIPGEPVRFGIVTSTKDNCYKMAVRVKFANQKPVSINKDFVCLPRNGAGTTDN